MGEVIRGCGFAEVSCAVAGIEAQSASAVQKTVSSENGWRERCIERRFMKALTLAWIAAAPGLKSTAVEMKNEGPKVAGQPSTL
jgi:hypothetical protein